MSGTAQTSTLTLRRLSGVGLLALVTYVFYIGLSHSNLGAFWFGLAGFPMAVGIATQTVGDPHVVAARGQVFGWAFCVTLALIAALLFLKFETIICVVIAAPLFLPLQFVGILIARAVLRAFDRDHTTKVQASLVALILLAPFAGVMPPLETRFAAVQNEITINAPASAVWAQIEVFGDVQQDERLWTISHNLLGAPMPIRSAIIGQERHAEWTAGVSYIEAITSRTATTMEWDIVFAPGFTMDGFDTHISPASAQMALLRGRYELEEQDGVTHVRLRTEYRISTALNAYVALWGQRFLADNHDSILHVLKTRAELGHKE